ncbi:MAG: hypothetical protein IJU94_03775 [Clostridia bacterium]|nr:hypothetical protein [Clostridia bacterium]
MKKLWIFLLVLALTLPFAVSCGSPDAKPAVTTESGTDGQTTAVTGEQGTDAQTAALTTEALTEAVYDPDILDTLPTARYGGKEFKFGLYNSQTYQFNLEGINGNQLDDALYRWVQTISRRYDVDFAIESGKWFKNVSAEILTGTSEINLYGGNAYEVYMVISQGCFRDWNALNPAMIDLTAKRWDRTLNESATFNGKLLAATGSLGVSKLLSTTALFYNTELLMKNGVDETELFELVDNYEWTFEEFEKLVKDIYFDNDNSNSKSDGDLFGYYAVDGNSMDVWFPSFGIHLTERDEENHTIIPTLWSDENLERNNGILERLGQVFHGYDSIFVGGYDHPGDATKFANGEAATVTVPFRNALTLFSSSMGTSAYGLLPTPMLDSDQHAYYSNLNDQYCIWGIPTSLPESELDFTAHIADALAAECSETVYYQYYDKALKNRYSKDENVARMVDVTMSNVVFDTAMQFGGMLAKGKTDITYEGYPYIPRNMLKFNKLDLSSVKAEIENALAADLQKVYDCYK